MVDDGDFREKTTCNNYISWDQCWLYEKSRWNGPGMLKHIRNTLLVLRTLDTIGNCQRPVSSLGVSQHNYCIFVCIYTCQVEFVL